MSILCDLPRVRKKEKAYEKRFFIKNESEKRFSLSILKDKIDVILSGKND